MRSIIIFEKITVDAVIHPHLSFASHLKLRQLLRFFHLRQLHLLAEILNGVVFFRHIWQKFVKLGLLNCLIGRFGEHLNLWCHRINWRIFLVFVMVDNRVLRLSDWGSWSSKLGSDNVDVLRLLWSFDLSQCRPQFIRP